METLNLSNIQLLVVETIFLAGIILCWYQAKKLGEVWAGETGLKNAAETAVNKLYVENRKRAISETFALIESKRKAAKMFIIIACVLLVCMILFPIIF